jgi:hypothetical protein
MQGLQRLFGSQKAWVATLAIIAFTLLAALGRMPSHDAEMKIWWIVLTLLGTQGLEDAAHKFALPPPSSTTTPQMVGEFIQTTGPAEDAPPPVTKEPPS